MEEPSALQTDRPPNGSKRARRAAYVVAIVRAFDNIDLDQIQDTFGWTHTEMEQVLTDINTLTEELKLLEAV